MEFTGERFLPIEGLLEDEIGIEHLHRYRSSLHLVTGKVVLDLACGEGYGGALLANKADWVYGVDIDKSTIEHATAKYTGDIGNLTFLTGNANCIPLDSDAVDIVVSFETIEHLDEENQQAFLNEIKRVLKKDGMLIISTPDKANYSDRYSHENEFHIKEFSRNEFSTFLECHFKYVNKFIQGFEVISAITETESCKVDTVSVCNWERPSKAFSRKYLISICSNHPLKQEIGFSSVVFDVNKDYFQLTDRMIEMDSHIQELGAWGKRLDAEIAQKDKKILSQQQEIATNMEKLSAQNSALEEKCLKQADLIFSLTTANLEKDRKANELNYLKEAQEANMAELRLSHHKAFNENLELQQLLAVKQKFVSEVEGQLKDQMQLVSVQAGAIESLNAKNNALTKSITELENQVAGGVSAKMVALKELQDSQNIIQEQKQKIHFLYQQIESLNGRLNEIFISEGWMLLKGYYDVKGKLLPEDSNRYRVLKKAVNSLRGKKDTIYINNSHPVLQQESILPQHIAQCDSSSVAIVYNNLQLPSYEFPKVSIVIPAYNAWEMNYECIKSIKENTLGVSYEVIIGDDASTDETKDIKDFIENIVVVRNEENLGFLQNCNHAASFAKGKYVLFLNNDTKVTPGWLIALVELMENDATIGMSGSKLIYPDGRLQEAGGIIWNDASGWNFGHKQDPDAPEFNYVKEVDYISGASIIVKADLWKEIGGFDAAYAPAYFEDTDLAFEIRKRGYKVVYQPLSQVIHFEGYSHGTEVNGQVESHSIKRYQQINKNKFFDKWKDTLERDHFPNAQNVFSARDRSKGKKTIVVVDHYVPHFDKDAGSRNTLKYLELFTSLQLNVKFIGDNFYKHEPYTTVLQQMGIEVLFGVHYRDNWQQWIQDNSEKIDYVYLSRPHISIKYIDFIKKSTKAKILYFGHDLHFFRELKQYEVEKNPELLLSAEKWKQTEMYLFEQSDVILTPSEEEKKIIKALVPTKQVQSIRLFFYKSLNESIESFKDRNNILFVGGFGHKPNVDGVLWFVNHVWPLVTQKLPGVKFIIVGSNAPAEILALANENILVKGFVSDDELLKLYKHVRLIVIPLRFGAGVKGKVVEAMYHGVPIVSTADGIEGLPGAVDFIEPANEAVQFANQVVENYLSEEKLIDLSKKEVSYMKQHFHWDTAKNILQEILELQ